MTRTTPDFTSVACVTSESLVSAYRDVGSAQALNDRPRLRRSPDAVLHRGVVAHVQAGTEGDDRLHLCRCSVVLLDAGGAAERRVHHRRPLLFTRRMRWCAFTDAFVGRHCRASVPAPPPADCENSTTAQRAAARINSSTHALPWLTGEIFSRARRRRPAICRGQPAGPAGFSGRRGRIAPPASRPAGW